VSKKHHVFLSYSRVDTEIMKRVKNSLRQAGLKIWTDEGIVPGTPSWKEAIEDAIRETEILVVLMSPDSNKSVWVQREIDYADVQDVQVLALLIRGEPRDSVPFALAGSQFIDLRTHYDDGMKLLISRCYEYMQRTGGVTVEHKRANPAAKVTRRKLPVLVGSSFVVILLILVGLFAMDILPITAPTATPTNTPTSIPTTELAIVPSDTPTRSRPTDTPIIPTDTPTRTPVPTDTPTRTPVPTDTLTPSPSPTPSGALQLRYNINSLVIYNRSNSSASILGLEFALITETGDESEEFASSRWGSAVTNLSAGQCVQVWRNGLTFLDTSVAPADICRTRIAYTTTNNQFWIADWEDAYFEVRRFGILLTSCPTIASNASGVRSCFIDVSS
jgi:hypothetical protein